MRHLPRSVVGILLLNAVSLVAQSNPPTPAPSTSASSASETVDQPTPCGRSILTDPMGVDFGPYLRDSVLRSVRWHWNELMPNVARAPTQKQGKVRIDFFILKDGSVAGVRLVDSSGERAFDRAAFGSIKTSNPFPPLPKEFNGPYLGLRFCFFYNLGPKKPGFRVSPVEVTVQPGSSVQFNAFDDDKEAAVTWSIAYCNRDCGTISATGLYTAPPFITPTPPKVTILAELASNHEYRTGATVTVEKPTQ